MSNKEIYLLSETQLGFYYEWIKNPWPWDKGGSL